MCDLKVLDLGTGTGFLGIAASTSEKVGHVVFADINRDAIRLAKANVAGNRAVVRSRCEFFHSNIFSSVRYLRKKFDLIIFNAPYLRSEEVPDLEFSEMWEGGKEGIELSLRFLKESAKYLNSNGKIILVASSLSNIKRLRREISGMGFAVIREKKAHFFFEDIIAMLISARDV